LAENFNNPPTDGLCRGYSTDLWFPMTKKGGLNAAERKKRTEDDLFVVETCMSCHATVQCLEYSLRHEPFGTWGGMTEIQRAELRQKRGISLSYVGSSDVG
jgi:WhiB family redox-sensing transcriptional regulator